MSETDPNIGGSSIKNRKLKQQQQQQQQQSVSFEDQQLPPQPRMPPQGNSPPPTQRQSPPIYQQPPPQQRAPSPQSPPSSQRPTGAVVEMPPVKKSSFSKSGFGSSSSNMQTALLVTVLFIILNSKIVWRQMMKLPFMGSVEPSMIALIVNSLIAGVIFFIITNFIIKI